MTRFDDMSHEDLRAEKDVWVSKVLMFAREYRSAQASGDGAWEFGIGVALDQALDQVRRLERLMKSGVAA